MTEEYSELYSSVNILESPYELQTFHNENCSHHLSKQCGEVHSNKPATDSAQGPTLKQQHVEIRTCFSEGIRSGNADHTTANNQNINLYKKKPLTSCRSLRSSRGEQVRKKQHFGSRYVKLCCDACDCCRLTAHLLGNGQRRLYSLG